MSRFITKAQVPTTDQALYVRRASDSRFDEYLHRNDYIAVIGPRVSGKTSLLVRKFHDLQSRQRYLPVYINLSLLVKLDQKAWYQRLHASIIEGVRSVKTASLATYELDLRDALLDLLEDELKSHILVMMLDDVEMIPQPILTPLMAMIREIFSSREIVPAFKRCVFVLAGCFLPDDLIADPTISPFRIAERIHLIDADLEGVRQLTNLLGTADQPVPESLAEQVYQWTEGDLYLTQRLCALLENSGQITKERVDQVAGQELTEDDIFPGVLRSLEKNPRIVELLKKINPGATLVRFTRLQRPIVEAWLAGVIKENANGNCVIRNQVYQAFLKYVNLDEFERLPDTATLPDDPNSQKAPDAQQTIRLNKSVLRKRYVLETSSGEGGMGKVFQATDLSTGEIVAIKRLLGDLASDPLYAERFQREAELLRKLKHPNIVRFIDLFDEQNAEYLVMEYVRGGNLMQLMHREGRSLSIQIAVNIAAGLAQALGHAHSFGIVHRDIKPGNILLTPELTPRLADFGIARIASAAPLTEDGELIGTIAYMSPEMCLGRSAGPQSDLWAVGVLLFEMLSGFPPFTGSNVANTLNNILFGPIPNIKDSRPDIPDGLAKIIDKLLTRDPVERYVSAQALLEDLGSLILDPNNARQ